MCEVCGAPKLLPQIEVVNFLKDHKKDLKNYQKFGNFSYLLHEGEDVEVITSINGQEETKNTLRNGQYLLTGISNEKYVVKPDVFAQRYKIVNDTTCEARGEVWGMQWKWHPMKFISPWGEDMICNTGDMLCSPDETISEVYRIEKEAFLKTYK